MKLVVEDSLISKVDALAVADEFGVRALMAHAARLRDEGHGNVITYSCKVFIPGDDLSAVILEALGASKGNLCDGGILIIAQKIVSKAEDRLVRLISVDPSPETQTLAREVHKDPRVVKLILRERLKSCAIAGTCSSSRTDSVSSWPMPVQPPVHPTLFGEARA